MFDRSNLTYGHRTVAARWNMSAGLLCLAAFLLAAGSVGAAGTISMPRARPEIVPGERSPTPETAAAPSQCQLRLAELAVFEPSPPITGPGKCMATDVVKVDTVLLPDKHRIVFSPPAILRCPMAEAVAEWIAEDVAPTIAGLGTSLRSIDNLDSFDCRPRNGINGAQVSEHGRANALDVRAFRLMNGEVIEPNSPSVAKSLRERLRESACARFSTVLGNGADAYHDTHIHLDLMERSNHYKICQWDVLDPAEAAALSANKAAATVAHTPAGTREVSDVPLPRPRPVVNIDAVKLPRHDGPRLPEAALRTPVAPSPAASSGASVVGYAEKQTVTVGPWAIAASYKGDKFEGCSMSRSTAEVDITFLRAPDGLLLVLESQKW
jgi:Extensin-like protein C-terminus